jgi:hypothetical protein
LEVALVRFAHCAQNFSNFALGELVVALDQGRKVTEVFTAIAACPFQLSQVSLNHTMVEILLTYQSIDFALLTACH